MQGTRSPGQRRSPQVASVQRGRILAVHPDAAADPVPGIFAGPVVFAEATQEVVGSGASAPGDPVFDCIASDASGKQDVLTLIPLTDDMRHSEDVLQLAVDSSPLDQLLLWQPTDEADQYFRRFLLDFGHRVLAAERRRAKRASSLAAFRPWKRGSQNADIAKKWPSRACLITCSREGVRCTCLRNGGGRGIRTPKGLAARWISSPLPCQLRLALRAQSRPLVTIHRLAARSGEMPRRRSFAEAARKTGSARRAPRASRSPHHRRSGSPTRPMDAGRRHVARNPSCSAADAMF